MYKFVGYQNFDSIKTILNIYVKYYLLLQEVECMELFRMELQELLLGSSNDLHVHLLKSKTEALLLNVLVSLSADSVSASIVSELV